MCWCFVIWNYNLRMFPLISPLHSHGASQMALVVKNLPANAGDIRDLGSIPGSGRSPGGGHGNPLQHSSPENPMDRGAWWSVVHGVEQDWSDLAHMQPLHSHIVTALHNKEVRFREGKWQNWNQEEIFSLWTCLLSSLLAAEESRILFWATALIRAEWPYWEMLFQRKKIAAHSPFSSMASVCPLLAKGRMTAITEQILRTKVKPSYGGVCRGSMIIIAFLVSSCHSFAYDFALAPSRRLPVPYSPWTWWSLKSSLALTVRTVTEACVNDILQQCRARSAVGGCEGMAAWQPERVQVLVQIDPRHLLIRKPLRSCSLFSWAPSRLWAPSSGCYTQQPFSSS